MATRGSILTGRKTAPAFRAPVVQQMAPVAMAQPKSPADVARIQQEQSKAMLQQPQQDSGLKALSPQEYRYAPQQPSGLKAVAPANTRNIPMETMKAFPQQPKKSVDTQASSVRTPNQQEYLARPDVRKENENFLRQQEAAVRRFNQQAPTMSPQAAQQAAAVGPKMPGMKKGGVVKKKPGYAKGGAVAKKTAASKYAKGGMATPKASNCGASMKPQQRKK